MKAIDLEVGRDRWTVHAREEDLLPVRREEVPPAERDPRAAVREALEHPLNFEPLRRALTPDDHITIVVDEHLPHLPELLAGVLEYVTGAGVSAESITILTPPPATNQGWIDDLPDEFADVRTEVHDPTNRQRLSYLATTRQGRRLYLNRTLVDADQSVILTGRGYDPVLGYSGCETAIYPGLADAETRQGLAGQFSMEAPGPEPWPIREEAAEVAWLLGAPFMVQVIEGPGDTIQRVVAGLVDTSAAGQESLDARWKVRVDRPADTVIATVSGDPARQGFAELAAALAAAARVVQPEGRIVLLSQAEPDLGEGADLLRRSEEPEEALRLLEANRPADWAAAYQWAQAASKAHIYLASDLHPEVVEELFATPISGEREVQRLLDAEGSFVFVPDAHKTLAVVEGE